MALAVKTTAATNAATYTATLHRMCYGTSMISRSWGCPIAAGTAVVYYSDTRQALNLERDPRPRRTHTALLHMLRSSNGQDTRFST